MLPDPLLVFDPNPKCFGATSALIHVIKHLKECELVILAGASAAQLTQRSSLPTIPCDVKDPGQVAFILNGLRRPYVYISISNLTNVPTVIAAGHRHIHIDILFWLTSSENPAMAHADAYIIENFPGVNDKLTAFGSAIRSPHVVGPLVDHHRTRSPSRTGRQPIIVNLGGAESPQLQPGKNTNYAVLMTQAVLEWAKRSSLTHDRAIYIGAGERAVQTIRDSLDLPSNVEVDTYSLDHFHALLGDCLFTITAPGLNAPFEAYLRRKPVVFLPPQNFTQVFQLKCYQDHGIHAKAMISLEELLDAPAIPTAVGELDGTAIVLERLKDLGSAQGLERLVSELERQVLAVMDEEQRKTLLLAQDRFMAELGDDGPQRTANIIKEVACASR
jgi:hypothetical protein